MDPDQRETAASRLRILHAIMLGLDRRHEVLDLVWDSATSEEARTRLRALLDVDEHGARAILDMQVRRISSMFRKELAAEVESLRHRLEQAH